MIARVVALRGLAALLAVAVALGGWWLGRLQGKAAVHAELDAMRLAADAEQQDSLAALAAERDTVAAQLAVSEGTVAELQRSLDTAAALTRADTEELAIYRRIASGELAPGLLLDRVERVVDAGGDGAERLRLTLVQARGRRRVAGSLGLALSSGAAGRSVWVDAADPDAPRFDLRFFEKIDWPVPGRPSPTDLLEIDLRPSSGPHKPQQLVRPWGEIPLISPQ